MRLLVFLLLLELPPLGDTVGCELGEAVRAFRADRPGPADPATGAPGPPCTPAEPRCWHDAVVADGPGRGDALATVLWDDGHQLHRRMHGSYALRRSNGEPCAPTSAAISGPAKSCQDGDCYRYSDACADRVGYLGKMPGSGRLGTCDDFASEGHCEGDLASFMKPRCPESCGLCRPTRQCLSLREMLPRLQFYARWGWYSQMNQDSVLHLLLVHPDGLFTPPGADFFVEFGFRPSLGMFGPDSNSEYLRRLGWRGVAFDLTHHEPRRSVYQESITAENVVDVFQRHRVPREPGVVMIDIDSCDLWVFLSLTKTFRPRVVQIEYNRHFRFEDNVTLDCLAANASSEPDVSNSDIYGASIPAIAAAASSRGYSVAWVERCFDVFLVRSDLVCPGTELPDLEPFRGFTAHNGCPDPWGWFAHPVPRAERRRRLLDLAGPGAGGVLA